MKRYLDLEEIAQDNRYVADSLVKISCNDCKGCDKCCHNMGDSIILDPYDIYEMGKAVSKDITELLNEELELGQVHGVILPHIRMQGTKDMHCSFLVNGRCSIHNHRPGFCRLFPLGRIYNDDSSFQYFNQLHECDYPNKSKIKVKKWIEIAEFGKYEKYIEKWHSLNLYMRKIVENSNIDKAKQINMYFLQEFFIKKYETDDFYTEFEERYKNFLQIQ